MCFIYYLYVFMLYLMFILISFLYFSFWIYCLNVYLVFFSRYLELLISSSFQLLTITPQMFQVLFMLRLGTHVVAAASRRNHAHKRPPVAERVCRWNCSPFHTAEIEYCKINLDWASVWRVRMKWPGNPTCLSSRVEHGSVLGHASV